MHEMSIISSIIELLEQKTKELKIKKLKKVNLEIGQMYGVITETMDFLFKTAVKETVFEKVKLKIHVIPVKIKCRKCLKETKPEDIFFICRHCQSRDIEITAGKELYIKSIEW